MHAACNPIRNPLEEGSEPALMQTPFRLALAQFNGLVCTLYMLPCLCPSLFSLSFSLSLHLSVPRPSAPSLCSRAFTGRCLLSI